MPFSWTAETVVSRHGGLSPSGESIGVYSFSVIPNMTCELEDSKHDRNRKDRDDSLLYYSEREDDLRHMVKKYCRIMGWEVSELDEQEARRLLVKAIHDALAKVEAEH
jgi:hypothetical protein